MLLPVLAALSLGVLCTLRRGASVEVGAAWDRTAGAAADYQAAMRAGAVFAQHDARRARGKAARKRAPSVDCCAAPSDDWRASREVYARWRPDAPLTYREAIRACFVESEESAKRGDYSKPATRRCALGKMHASKLSAWSMCRHGCGPGRSDPLVELFGDGGGDADEWDVSNAFDGSGGRVWRRAGSSELARVSPDRGGWAVDVDAGAGWRRVDWYEDEITADEAARALLDTPF